MAKIKLLKLDELKDGTQRFQSQLYVGKHTSDFIMGKDGIMKCYGKGVKGNGKWDFYEYTEPYEIVQGKTAMRFQAL